MRPLMWCVLVCLQVLWCSHQDVRGEKARLKSLKFRSPDLFPESFDWDQLHDRFLLGSENHGTVSELGNDGLIREFVRDAEYAGRAGIAGVKVDSRRNRVVVTVADHAGGWRYGGVAAYDLDSKERVYFARLDGVGVGQGEKICANDVAVNVENGDVYVTNTFGNFLWRVTSDGVPSVLVKHELFTSQPMIVAGPFQGFSFNGIVYASGRYVVAVQMNSGALFRVNVEDGSVHKVVVKGNHTFPMTDGMVLRADGALVVVSAEKIWLVGSTNRWMTANVIDTVALNASVVTTAAVVKKGSVTTTFVLHSFLNDLFAGKSREEFEIREMEFPSDVAQSDPVWLVVLIVALLVVVTLWRFQMGHYFEQFKRKKG